ncbi:serine protease [bacterium]|nr:serine protease [bacterium]
MRIAIRRFLCGALVLAAACPAAALAQDTASSGSNYAVASAVALVRPSVVAIETRFEEPLIDDDYAYWQYFRGARPLYGLWGTGFIYKDPQYVITTSMLMDHVKYIRVILDDGRSYSAEMVGENEDLETVVLKVDWGPDLEPISPPFGDSDQLKLGQPIAIVGKALNSTDTYATAGVVSAIRKEIPGTDIETDKFLQFDASYEFSFTGAPIVDVSGNVVGMVDRTATVAGVTNINLGVPINDIIFIADKIISGQDVEIWIGTEVLELTRGIIEQGYAPGKFDWDGDGEEEDVEYGMWVSYVSTNSPADIAGLQVGDLIVELDDQFMKAKFNWDNYIRGFLVGQLILVKFIRKSPMTDEFERLETQLQVHRKIDEDEDGEESGGMPPGHPSY